MTLSSSRENLSAEMCVFHRPVCQMDEMSSVSFGVGFPLTFTNIITVFPFLVARITLSVSLMSSLEKSMVGCGLRGSHSGSSSGSSGSSSSSHCSYSLSRS